MPEKRGLVLNTAGKVVGEHAGAHFYTIGQRSGLGVGGNSRPVYIAEKDIKENAILVAEENDPALCRKEIKLRNINFIGQALPSFIRANGRIDVLARVRYRQPLVKAQLYEVGPHKIGIIFEKPIKFVAPGQSAVFYRARRSPSIGWHELLGGGIIDK